MSEKANKKAGQTAGKPKRRLWLWLLSGLAGLTVLGAVGAAVGVFLLIAHYGRGLPEVDELADYEPPIITRVHAGDGSLLTEFARERRLFIPVEQVPERLVQAYLAAEDKNFYSHNGLDYFGIARAMVQNVIHVVQDKRLVGASTITQQVARNFLLTLERTVDRKAKEAILAWRIERAFTKDEILELYLNEIYLGYGSYGVAAAALNYFNRALHELSLAEMAYLAALPKGPNNYHPVRRKMAGIARRNWVLNRMAEEGFITETEAEAAKAEDLIVREREGEALFRADYFEEEVRRELYSLYGDDQLYEGGLSVRTTLEPRLQAIAERTLRDGLVAYDRRHGWRGPLAEISMEANWDDRLGELNIPLGHEDWRLALVLELRGDGAVIGFEGGGYGFIPFEAMTWARPWIEGQRVGPEPGDVSEVLSLGDVVPVSDMGDDQATVEIAGFYNSDGTPAGPVRRFALEQVPDIEGALVAMDPHTGRVLAMMGGWDYSESQFNRATQAERQPGSAFKPIVYAAALDAGFTPSSLVLDAPFVIDQGDGQGMWKPTNSSNRFYGPSTLRTGIERSRNLMTVRIAQYIGMERVVNYARRLGVGKNIQPTLSMALGAGEVTLLDLTKAYAQFVNGGKRITPTLIDRVQNRYGETVLAHGEQDCLNCEAQAWIGQREPVLEDGREQILDPRTAYQVVSMMEGVVERGTGRRIRTVGKPLAGKTGTTNDWIDGWFVGFSPDLVVGVFVGFDRPRTMGVNEEGSAVAVPVFRDFMAAALEGEPATPFRTPSGLRLVRVNAETGLPAGPDDTNVILEAFVPGTEPIEGQRFVLDGPESYMRLEGRLRKGTGGLY